MYAPRNTMLQVIELDNGLRHYAQVIKEYTNMDISQLPGAGAAGGMGGGLLPFECRIAIRNRSYIENASFRGGRPTGRPDTDRRGNWIARLVWERRWTEFYVGEKCQVQG